MGYALDGLNLDGLNLQGLNLQGLNLHGLNLHGLNLVGVIEGGTGKAWCGRFVERSRLLAHATALAPPTRVPAAC